MLLNFLRKRDFLLIKEPTSPDWFLALECHSGRQGTLQKLSASDAIMFAGHIHAPLVCHSSVTQLRGTQPFLWNPSMH